MLEMLLLVFARHAANSMLFISHLAPPPAHGDGCGDARGFSPETETSQHQTFSGNDLPVPSYFLPPQLPASADGEDAFGIIAERYCNLLLQSSSQSIFQFNHHKLDQPIFAIPGISVKSSSGRLMRANDLPVPGWCGSDVSGNMSSVDASNANVSLDKVSVFVVEFVPVIVNDVVVHVGICNCDRVLASAAKLYMQFPEKLVVREGDDLLKTYLSHLRELLRQQPRQGWIPRDFLVCLHVHALSRATYKMSRATIGAHNTATSTALLKNPHGDHEHPDAEVGFLPHCHAYCVVDCGDADAHAVAMRRYTYKLACPEPACNRRRQRCVHLRSLADRIAIGRQKDSSFILGIRETDDMILAQVSRSSPVRSSRTHEQSMKLLDSFTKGPLPLTILDAPLEFLNAVCHHKGWARQLVPSAPSSCPNCNKELLPPLTSTETGVVPTVVSGQFPSSENPAPALASSSRSAITC